MRVAHLADSHLGVRRYHREHRGQNIREMDVARAFAEAIDQTIAARPDLVVHAGDLFESVKPSNACSLFTYQQFKRLRDALPDVPVIVIEGNHDMPRSASVGSPLTILGEIGVHVVTRSVTDLRFPALDLAVRAVPFPSLSSPYREPPGDARYQVLVLHGQVSGVYPSHYQAEGGQSAVTVPPDQLTGGWSYVALGDYHVQHEVAPGCWYAGASDYVSTNIWGELSEEATREIPGKAWLLADLDAGTVTPQRLTSTRAIHDLPRFDADGMTGDQIMALITERVEAIPGGLESTIVRLVVTNVPVAVQKQLDHTQIRQWKANALDFGISLRKPEVIRVGGLLPTQARREMTLDQLVAHYMHNRDLPPGIDRGAFVRAAAALMDEDSYCGMPKEETAA